MSEEELLAWLENYSAVEAAMKRLVKKRERVEAADVYEIVVHHPGWISARFNRPAVDDVVWIKFDELLEEIE